MTEKSFLKEKNKNNQDIKNIIRKKDMKALQEHLQEGVASYLDSDIYRNYLNFVSKFHKYSDKNNRLILAQNPNAERVAGFNAWKKLNRNVMKGSKALYVYAPITVARKDKEGKKIVDDNGEIQTDTYFSLKPVFDISQTEGEPIPQQVYNLTEDMDDKNKFVQTYKSLVELSPAPVSIESFTGKAEGYYSPKENKIVLQEGLGEVMTLKVLIHEMTHAYLHTNSQAIFGDSMYRKQEFEAESVAYIVANHLGMDTSNYSFGYLSSWTQQGNKIEELTESLTVITQQAKEMIERIDEKLDMVYSLNAPRNEFEKRLAEAKNMKMTEPREPAKEHNINNPKVQSPTMNQ